MRLRGRQARFLFGVISGWALLRVVATWPAWEVGPAPVPVPVPVVVAESPPVGRSAGRAVGRRRLVTFARHPVRLSPERKPIVAARHRGLVPESTVGRGGALASRGTSSEMSGPRNTSGVAEGREAARILLSDIPPVPMLAPSAPPPPVAPRRIVVQAYLFIRPGSGRALAAGNALGGSQIAARIALPIDSAGHVAAVGRHYAPLRSAGAEVAAGLDWRPLPNVPLRVSIERRQRVDRAGRSAWSAYAAGGFWRALPGSVHVDGYAQAGIVGARRRDLFADGALRLERDASVGPALIGLGGGVWAAAQPQAERLDAGPRASLRLPARGHPVSLAIEGRFRLAGRSRPGSGIAVTLAGDL